MTETLEAPDFTLLDRFYGAMGAGDIAGLRACCTPDALFWHCFDGVAQDIDTAAIGWAGLANAFSDIRLQDARRSADTNGRIVSQHMFVARRKANGAAIAFAVCLLVSVRDGLIARIDEYIDRSGVLAVASEESATPGLAAPTAA